MRSTRTAGGEDMRPASSAKKSAAAWILRRRTEAWRSVDLPRVVVVPMSFCRVSEYEAREVISSGVAKTSGRVWVVSVKDVGCCDSLASVFYNMLPKMRGI